MGLNHQSERPAPDPHFERLHGHPLIYARSIQSFLQSYEPQPASTIMGFPTEASKFSLPTVPDAVDFTKAKAAATDMPPPPTPDFLSGPPTPCESTCSVVNCASGCNPSVLGSESCSLSQCNNLDQCTSEECCREPACLDHSSLPTTRRESVDFSALDQYASSSQHQFVNAGAVFPTYDNLAGFDSIDDDPLRCHWLLPDQECDITAPTNDALSQHVFQNHIQPETSLTCGWYDCDEQVSVQQFTDHLWNNHHPEQHVPDSYICLWDGCMEMFSDAEQLETHMGVTHTQLENVDCRWGGCGTITTNSAELQSHVNEEHLRLSTQSNFPSSNLEVDLSDGHSSRQPKHPLYWSPENDDLLMRVRAQNIAFPQIASQYFPDKSARACQFRYGRLQHREKQSNPQPIPQPIEQSTPLLTYSPLQPASYATSSYPSPYESNHPLIDPPLLQSSPALLSTPSSQLDLDKSPPQASHKCMWIIDTTDTVCEARFENPNELQAHIESSHEPLFDNRKRKPATFWVCKWSGCARKGETRGTRDKLKKHVWTHTGSKLALSK